jgi:RimJ/RimL family protein N-acetyltransferase
MNDLLPKEAVGVTLRRLSARDLSAFTSYRADPEVARYQSWTSMTDPQARAFLSDMETTSPLPHGGWWQIAIAQTADDTLIGDIGLCLTADGTEVELGITLARAAQGRGHAQAAIRAAADVVFTATSARRLLLITDARNTAAQHLFARLGLSQIDTLHEMGFPEPVFELRRGPRWTST